MSARRSLAVQGEENKANLEVDSHMKILFDSTRHIGLSAISCTTVSSFIPSAMNMFAMVDAIMGTVVDNPILHQMCPDFFCPTMTLYYGHVYFYHILRARKAAGSLVITRLERRALKCYERVGPPEAWPIAAPLLGFLQYLGSHKPDDPMFGWITPALPDFSYLNHEGNGNCLGSLDTMHGSARIPPIPALQKLVYNFAHNIADFENGVIRPIGQDNIDATHTYCGIKSSAKYSGPFLALTGNVCWTAPQDTGDYIGPPSQATKKNQLRRWPIPNVPDNQDCSTLAGFLGLSDYAGLDWMRKLLATSAIVNRFFPGSGNLSQVSPVTTLGMATRVKYRCYHTLTTITMSNNWFYDHSSIGTMTIDTHGYTDTESGLLDTKMAIAASPNASFDCITVAPAGTLDPMCNGPFFTNRNQTEHKAQVVTESYDEASPTTRFKRILQEHYDHRGGQSSGLSNS